MSNLHKDIGVPSPVAERAPDVVTCPSCRSRWKWVARDRAGKQVRCSRCSEVFAVATSPRAYRLRAVDVAAAPDAAPAPAVAGAGRAVHVTARIGRAAAGLRVGMDDPSLAEKVARSSLNARGEHGPRAWSWTVVADETVSAATPEPTSDEPGPGEVPAPGPASLREAPLPAVAAAVPSEDAATPPTPAVDAAPVPEAPAEEIGVEWAFEDSAAGTEAEVEAAEAEDVRPAPARARRREAAVAGFAAVLGLAAAGAAAGWWAAGPLAATMSRWTEMWPPIADWVVPTDPMFWTAPGAATGLLVAWMWVRWMQRAR